MQHKQEKVKEAILQAAKKEFIAKGYQAASIRSIAEKAEVSVSNIYNYFDETPLTIHDIKELEKQEEFERNRIGKIQFEEIWYYSHDQMKMEKHVYSVMLAYEVYRNDGSFRGYKPAFKIYFE